MKYLIFGSAWYIESWFEDNKSNLDGMCLVAINNSAKVVFRHKLLHRWYTSTDFFILKYHNDINFNIHEYCNFYKFGYTTIISGDFMNTPYGYSCPHGGTMILNVCYDLLNKSIIRNENCTVGIIGCDLIYNKPKTHFYEGGSDDPMRLYKPTLKNYLKNLQESFVSSNRKIYNLSSEQESLLPFDRISMNEFVKLI